MGGVNPSAFTYPDSGRIIIAYLSYKNKRLTRNLLNIDKSLRRNVIFAILKHKIFRLQIITIRHWRKEKIRAVIRYVIVVNPPVFSELILFSEKFPCAFMQSNTTAFIVVFDLRYIHRASTVPSGHLKRFDNPFSPGTFKVCFFIQHHTFSPIAAYIQW